MNIIFLDIDGVLNNQDYIIEIHPKVLELYSKKDYDESSLLRLKRLMMDIDKKKVKILKEIIKETNSFVVVISSWKTLGTFPYVRRELIKMGIPIIDVTDDYNSNRGEGIKNYLKNNDNIKNYIILDDEIFEDYDEELLSHLVKTSFYEDGLTEVHKESAIKKLTRNS